MSRKGPDMEKKDTSWWSRYGNFAPGVGVYPHMGQVITSYRIKRGFRKQDDLAIALGCSKRTIEELEGAANLNTPDSVERRQVIARLLKIPPALLALDWRFLVYSNHDGQQQTFADAEQMLEDNTFALYQNILRMGRGYLYNGGPGYIAGIVDESLDKLFPLAKQRAGTEKEPWLELLCRYYQLSTSFALRRLDKKQTMTYSRKAIEVAHELENPQLLAAAYYRRIRVHLDLRKAAKTPEEQLKQLKLAQVDAQTALSYVDQINPILKGNIYLIAGEVASLSPGDHIARKQCDKWQEKAATIVYRNEDCEDDTFLRLNATALHHEKAKTLLQFGNIRDAESELTIARKTLQADLLTWHINLHLTESTIYTAQNDLEASAASALEAYKIAQVIQSPKDENEVKKIFLDLKRRDDANPYVCNLGVTVGMY